MILIWYQAELLKPLSLFHDLTLLKLSLDFEVAVNDSLKSAHNLAW
jgi:hypothetical protein